VRLFPKLALAVSTLLIGTTICLSLAFYATERRYIRQQANQERLALLHNLVHIAQESFVTNDDLLLVKYTGWLQKWNSSLVSASVVTPNGEILAHSEPARIGKPETEAPVYPAHVLVMTESVRMGNRWMATASLGFSEHYFEELVQARLRQLQRRLFVIAGAALLLGLVISFGMALSWTRPIGRLASVAEFVGRGKYEFDLGHVPDRRDELGFLASAFKRMTVQLRELDAMKEDFVSAVTHELRSPLGAIESYLNLISHEFESGIALETWQTYLERMRINTQRLTRFVNDLLDVAAFERGKITLERRPIHLSELVHDIIHFFTPKLLEKMLRCDVGIPSSLPACTADPEKIRQVLTNLLANAIKFTPDGGCITIRGEELSAEKQIRLSVSDTGIGISATDQAKIFSKFEQVSSARPTVKGPKGTGLGLAICKALIELHGGELGVRSFPGQGSTFYFTLPLNAPAKEKSAHEQVVYSLH